MELKPKTLKIHPSDNIIVALVDLKKGEKILINNKPLKLIYNIKAKHKFSTDDLKIGDKVYMYGVIVGIAKKQIFKSEPITTQNIVHETEEYSVPTSSVQSKWIPPNLDSFSNKTFLGYKRGNGSVGTENNWLVIPLVFCQNRNIEVLKNTMLEELGYQNLSKQIFDLKELVDKFKSGASEDELLNVEVIANYKKKKNPLFPNVDGIYFLTHEGGCGGSTDDSKTLCNLLAGYINNPNVAGATILSLGCQHAQISLLQRSLKRIAPESSKPVFFLEQQQSSSENQYIAEAIKKTFKQAVK